MSEPRKPKKMTDHEWEMEGHLWNCMSEMTKGEFEYCFGIPKPDKVKTRLVRRAFNKMKKKLVRWEGQSLWGCMSFVKKTAFELPLPHLCVVTK